MRFVLDASVAASWCFDDENERVADLAFDLLEVGSVATAPLQLWFEVRNVVLVGLRRNRLTPDGMVSALARIDSATVDFDPLPESARIVMSLAVIDFPSTTPPIWNSPNAKASRWQRWIRRSRARPPPKVCR